jgi:hypothetical protein
MNRKRTPIALFAYDRPAHVVRALESLSGCPRLDECRLHIYCDGPRDSSRWAAVEQTCRLVRDWAHRLGARVVERSENLGLARSIVTGVTELCQEHGRVIVVEDDIEVAPGFLDYMLGALDHYEDAAGVHQVSAYMFPVAHPPTPDAFFLPLVTTWGWATWARAWEVFSWEAGDAVARLSDPAVCRRFDLEDSYPYHRLLADRLAGRNDSWGILWWWAVFQAGGLALHPRRSLVWVGGWDGTGTHCGGSGGDPQDLREQTLAFRFDRPIGLPTEIVMDQAAFARVTGYLRRQRSPRRTPQAVHGGTVA